MREVKPSRPPLKRIPKPNFLKLRQAFVLKERDAFVVGLPEFSLAYGSDVILEAPNLADAMCNVAQSRHLERRPRKPLR